MKRTPNIFLNKPQSEDYVKVSDFNQNADIMDLEIANIQGELARKAPVDSPIFTGKVPRYLYKNSDGSFSSVNLITELLLSSKLEVEKLD